VQAIDAGFAGSEFSAESSFAVIPPPHLTSAGVDTNGFRLQFESVAGLIYVTEYGDSIASGPWTELERRFGSGGIEVVVDPDIGQASRFYRVRAVYAPSPTLGAATWTGSAVSFSVPTVEGARYVVEYKDDLDDLTWLELEARLGTGDVWQIIDPGPLPASRFYRVRVR
jgi:hypothetical protein